MIANLSDPVRKQQLENFGLFLNVGEIYIFQINENPTTGYTWNLLPES